MIERWHRRARTSRELARLELDAGRAVLAAELRAQAVAVENDARELEHVLDELDGERAPRPLGLRSLT